MGGNEILLLGLGMQAPWQLVDQRLDLAKQPHEPHLQVSMETGSDTILLASIKADRDGLCC